MKNNRQTSSNENTAFEGRLTARPTLSSKTPPPIESGLHSFAVEDGREFLLRVPAAYNPEHAAPLALMLHGAGGNAEHGIDLLQNFADEFGIVLLAVKSLYQTWDIIAADAFGADVEFIDRAIEQVFERCNIDDARIAVCGFSDGASYALSLGLINGDLFTHVIAFSPGFMLLTRQAGTPRVYISHGTRDNVLPIDRCSRRIAPQIERAGYDLIYREFEGAHTLPPQFAREAAEWLQND